MEIKVTIVTDDYQAKLSDDSEDPELDEDIDPEISEMFELAQREGRQPNCIYCGNPLEIGQSFYTDIHWKWNHTLQGYEKFEDRDSDCDKPYCLSCHTHDWDFTNNKCGFKHHDISN